MYTLLFIIQMVLVLKGMVNSDWNSGHNDSDGYQSTSDNDTGLTMVTQ